jgi:zinc transporter, ZIP family
MNIFALLATFVVGLFMLVGAGIVFYQKDSKKIVTFSIGMAFSIMLALLGKELIHEATEHLGIEENFMMASLLFVVFVVIGGLILKYLDKYIPHHHEDHCHDHHHDEKNLYHVGIMALVAIVLHNVIEGMALYGVFENSFSAGIWFSIGIILHNIPLGMAVAATIYKSTKDVKKTFLYTGLMGGSTLIGGLVMYPISNLAIGEMAIGILLSLTVGMILYILIFEFLDIVIDKIKEKAMIYGLLIGFLISLIGGGH